MEIKLLLKVLQMQSLALKQRRKLSRSHGNKRDCLNIAGADISKKDALRYAPPELLSHYYSIIEFLLFQECFSEEMTLYGQRRKWKIYFKKLNLHINLKLWAHFYGLNYYEYIVFKSMLLHLFFLTKRIVAKSYTLH